MARKGLLKRLALFLLGLSMLPLCIASSSALVSLTRSVYPLLRSGMSRSTLAFGLGFGLWVFVYLTMPRPVRTYVLAHELTHVLWAWLTGARVSRLKLSKLGQSRHCNRCWQSHWHWPSHYTGSGTCWRSGGDDGCQPYLVRRKR